MQFAHAGQQRLDRRHGRKAVLVGVTTLAFAASPFAPSIPGIGSGPATVVAAEHALAGWHTSFDQAMAEAESTGKPVLAVFTGSDWCPHCRTLENNVLATPTFREWAEGKVILLVIDLPQQGITEAVRVERSKVCIRYGVRNFPAVLMLGPDGSKLGEKRGYQNQSAASWVTDMAQYLPSRPAPAAVVASVPRAADRSADLPSAATPGDGVVLDSLDKAIETARGTKRPILLVVARPGDKAARSHSDSLIADPEFAPFVQENFVVAHVPPTAESGSQEAESIENLLGGVELAPDAVELIVTDDGQTPLFSQSGAQPPARIVHGLRRFLAARQASRFGTSAVR
mgnify:CR=1 FL=1